LVNLTRPVHGIQSFVTKNIEPESRFPTFIYLFLQNSKIDTISGLDLLSKNQLTIIKKPTDINIITEKIQKQEE